ncbi:MAG TPA: hypothetical protein VHX66_05360 [Solirubrobacteraceae bacterium]|jgi:hypothetical protein|nr:hypothetical protein [Solirubrobacteraceae bacterium]
MTDDNEHHRDHGTGSYLSAEAVAAAVGTSLPRLRIWLLLAHEFGIRVERLSPLLPLAAQRLTGEGSAARSLRSRERLVLTPAGIEPAECDDPDEHALIDRHLEAVALAALTGDDRALRRFVGRAVRGVELAADLVELQRWAHAALDSERNG